MNFAIRCACWIRWVLCLAVLSNGLISSLMPHSGMGTSAAMFIEICTDRGIVQVAADTPADAPSEAPTPHTSCPFCLHSTQSDIAPGPLPWLAAIDTQVMSQALPRQTHRDTSSYQARHPVRAPPVIS
ncbi:DUF2946 family protein [Denitromonas halophila]|uniref:DUF2946 domain-containing protein n=1 Tax=Denitromonas halophila TaxID=1629404 RepID=A0A557QGE7_9RHOO|nr:DUF2946 family protein [Denitromonas halophila]TVO51963.1 hypothetical protein FHP91_18890 [Denitromonas halophila]